MIEFSVIMETYNLKEGTDWNRFRAALRAVSAMIPNDGSAEVIVADVLGSPELIETLVSEFPQVRRISADTCDYDAVKTMAAHSAFGQYLLFLDADCIPAAEWHLKMLKILKGGAAVVCGGYTRYEGGFFAALMSVMDFGFLYPRVARDLSCYASNNSGFRREVLLSLPAPEGDLRCRCYSHTQQLQKYGSPARFVPDAQVLHAWPPVLRERSRQGYDLIAARWADPSLPQAGWLRLGILSLPLFYALDVLLDWKRMWAARLDLGLTYGLWSMSFILFPFFRLLDVSGMSFAFIHGAVKGGWGGFEKRTRAAQMSNVSPLAGADRLRRDCPGRSL